MTNFDGSDEYIVKNRESERQRKIVWILINQFPQESAQGKQW